MTATGTATVTLEEKQALCAAEVTLNGHRAKITGYSLPFAKVTSLDAGLSAEWAWSTVQRIVARGGAFNS